MNFTYNNKNIKNWEKKHLHYATTKPENPTQETDLPLLSYIPTTKVRIKEIPYKGEEQAYYSVIKIHEKEKKTNK